jgi:pantoate--beta-alanine ligase
MKSEMAYFRRSLIAITKNPMISNQFSECLILKNVGDVRAYRRRLNAAGLRLALVPTMGFLHDGHTRLMSFAATQADVAMASIFVNPTQFGPDEDFDAYPRDTDGDIRKAADAGCKAVFLPDVSTMYGEQSQTRVEVGSLTTGLCGVDRPTHFSGVSTIVLKLLNITQCDVAIFGEKDYQQLAVIRRMVDDLNVPVKIVGHPIVREIDGLAMSSRNAYLSPVQRKDALALNEALTIARQAWGRGERRASVLTQLMRDRIQSAGEAHVDYIRVCDLKSLHPIADMCVDTALCALAVRFGQTRLIDNTVLASAPHEPS